MLRRLFSSCSSACRRSISTIPSCRRLRSTSCCRNVSASPSRGRGSPPTPPPLRRRRRRCCVRRRSSACFCFFSSSSSASFCFFCSRFRCISSCRTFLRRCWSCRSMFMASFRVRWSCMFDSISMSFLCDCLANFLSVWAFALASCFWNSVRSVCGGCGGARCWRALGSLVGTWSAMRTMARPWLCGGVGGSIVSCSAARGTCGVRSGLSCSSTRTILL
ncbi:hypothetical protein F5Y12DRAFT_751390 [Xylaria sp. FL1777]|nr:hypothetical protein F5Y12DRAFT_751390 [Xylaria sp. FL1777]